MVHNEPSGKNALPRSTSATASPLPRPFTVKGENQQQRKEKRASRKAILIPAAAASGINRRGLILAKPIDETPLLIKGKGGPPQFVQASPRLVTVAPSDPFLNQKNGGIFGNKVNGNGIMDFRPHQPDVTQDAHGKLSLPVVGYANHQHVHGLQHVGPSPTPMANKINPFTNGVASSFPPGIDPYEGFIRYAAENLDSPVGNVIDYHSLEHYYAPHFPLIQDSTSNNDYLKGANLDSHPYADSFAYNGNGGSREVGNSPLARGPPPPPPLPPSVGTAVTQTHDGFRARDNADNPSVGLGDSGDHTPINPFDPGHGIDHFHAPSPGLEAAPPIPREPPSEPSSDEEEHGPPFVPKGPGGRGPPFGNSPSPSHNNKIPPPDLRVFEEGPPPELMNSGPPPSFPPSMGGGGGPPPPPHSHSPSPHPHPHSHPSAEATEQSNDGGDDAIWGILDLAEMLERGQIPGQGPNKKGNSPGNRVVIPANAGANPPTPPFGIDENSSAPAASSYDYDDGGSEPHRNPLDSQEANDYEDQYRK